MKQVGKNADVGLALACDSAVEQIEHIGVAGGGKIVPLHNVDHAPLCVQQAENGHDPVGVTLARDPNSPGQAVLKAHFASDDGAALVRALGPTVRVRDESAGSNEVS